MIWGLLPAGSALAWLCSIAICQEKRIPGNEKSGASPSYLGRFVTSTFKLTCWPAVWKNPGFINPEGLKRIRLRLYQKREKKQGGINDLCQSILKSDNLAEMKHGGSVMSLAKIQTVFSGSFQLGYENIQSRLDNFLFTSFFFWPIRIEELHQMRIAAKRLRYTLRFFPIFTIERSMDALEITRRSSNSWEKFMIVMYGSTSCQSSWKMNIDRILFFYVYLRPFNRIKPG